MPGEVLPAPVGLGWLLSASPGASFKSKVLPKRPTFWGQNPTEFLGVSPSKCESDPGPDSPAWLQFASILRLDNLGRNSRFRWSILQGRDCLLVCICARPSMQGPQTRLRPRGAAVVQRIVMAHARGDMFTCWFSRIRRLSRSPFPWGRWGTCIQRPSRSLQVAGIT